MKKAIITGATGLVGKAVAHYFSTQGIDVLCLGRKALSAEEVQQSFGPESNYAVLGMDDIDLLISKIKSIPWSSGEECVFFNFAWQGNSRLTDGSFSDQMNNAIYAAEAVKTAKIIGCTKFVNIGSLEETFIEQHLNKQSDTPYESGPTDYALAKLASRDMCKMVAYLQKIDYIHVRLSIPLDPTLSHGTYVSTTLKQIAKGQAYKQPDSQQLFDIISTDDVARACYQIGLKGKNKADYFIGSSQPATLAQYFKWFEEIVEGNHSEQQNIISERSKKIFSTENLYKDTGFTSPTLFQNLFQNLQKS